MDLLEKYFNEPDCSFLLEKVLDSIHDGVYILNSDGEFIIINKAVESITLYDRNKLYGTKASELVKKGLINYSITERVMKTKKEVTELQIVMGPVLKEIMVTSTPVLDDENNIKYIVANLRDITELNKIKMERETAKKVIEEYNLEIIKNEYIKDNIISKSKEMREVLDLAKRASQSCSTIILYGESGSGKEVIAKFAYSLSPRRNKPFITINCAAIPENLLESELFGYEKGAFTDANKSGKIGLFELADGGTLFLDEINSLPLVLQGKILRFIETQELKPLGGTKSKTVDVRIIAATNVKLEEMVEEGKFREDLYFRLNVIPIEIPPLRIRKEDIVPLTYLFLEYFNKENNKNKEFSVQVLDYFESYNWPGNVRELRNIVERLVVMSSESLITIDDLPTMMLNKIRYNTDYSITVNTLVPLNTIVKEAERALFKKAFEDLKVTREIAKALKISQTSVVRKINEYKIR